MIKGFDLLRYQVQVITKNCVRYNFRSTKETASEICFVHYKIKWVREIIWHHRDPCIACHNSERDPESPKKIEHPLAVQPIWAATPVVSGPHSSHTP